MPTQYQVAYIPQVATGRWSFRAHGALHTRAEAMEAKQRLQANGYTVRLLPVTASNKGSN